MTTSGFYKKKKVTGGLSKLAGSIIYVSSVVYDKPYPGKLHKLTKEEAAEQCVPSIYNGRSFEDLTMAAVVDIYADINDTGGNETLAKGCMIDGKIHVIVGLRRLFCVLNSRDAQFNIVVVDGMHEEDQRHIAKVEDTYVKPTILDLGYKVMRMREEAEENTGKATPFEVIAKQLGRSKGQVVEAANYTRIPEWIIGKFPGFRYISHKWLRLISKYEESFGAAKKKIEQIDAGPESFANTKEAEEFSKKLAAQIRAVLVSTAVKGNKPIDQGQKWVPNPIKGVFVTGTSKQLVIKLAVNQLDNKKMEQIKKLLSS